MNAKELLKITPSGELDALQVWAFLDALPEGFSPRSFSAFEITLRPEADLRKILTEECGLELRAAASFWRKRDAIVVATAEHAVATFEVGDMQVSGRVVSDDLEASERAGRWLGILRRYEATNKEEAGVWIEITRRDQHGMVQRHRQFRHCPTWKEIQGNYVPETREAVARVATMAEPWARGRLLIWHGEPGSGKTYAARSLMMEWRDRFDFVFVSDPDILASDPGYYLSLASERFAAYHPDAGILAQAEHAKKRFLFIMEDCAELVVPESRIAHHDKIGKLLNITDGILGQGREDMFLLTFNEKIDAIDQAFLRPGRCVAETEFRKFSKDEASCWLAAKGVPEADVTTQKKTSGFRESGGEVSLATLYEAYYAALDRRKGAGNGHGR